MKVAVTGASGFLGRYLVEALSVKGHATVALGRDLGSLAPLAGPAVTVRATDYSEVDLGEALSGVEAVVHLAGLRTQRSDEPMRFWKFAEANLQTLETLLFASRDAGVSRFVLASTAAVYSEANVSPYVETDHVFPLNPYGLSKLYAEQMVDLWARRTPMTGASLRIAASYGHGERVSAALMRFIDDAIAGRPLKLIGNRQTQVESLYVRDVVDAMVAAVVSKACGAINIGPGTTSSLIEMASAVNEAFDNPGGLILTESHVADTVGKFMRIDRAAELLDWRPRRSLRQGLEDYRETSQTQSPGTGAPDMPSH